MGQFWPWFQIYFTCSSYPNGQNTQSEGTLSYSRGLVGILAPKEIDGISTSVCVV